jgi:hypothetical protein
MRPRQQFRPLLMNNAAVGFPALPAGNGSAVDPIPAADASPAALDRGGAWRLKFAAGDDAIGSDNADSRK